MVGDPATALPSAPEPEEPESRAFHDQILLQEGLSEGHVTISYSGWSRIMALTEPQQVQRWYSTRLDHEVVAARTHYLLDMLPGVSYCAVENQMDINRQFRDLSRDDDETLRRAALDFELYELGTIPSYVPHPMHPGTWCPTVSWLWGFGVPALRVLIWRRCASVLWACESAQAVVMRLLRRRRKALENASRRNLLRSAVGSEATALTEESWRWTWPRWNPELDARRLRALDDEWFTLVIGWTSCVLLLKHMTYEQISDHFFEQYDLAESFFQEFSEVVYRFTQGGRDEDEQESDEYMQRCIVVRRQRERDT